MSDPDRPTASRPSSRVGRENASALIICLFVVVLITVVLVAYFAIVNQERQISAGSAAQIRVDRLSEVALSTTLADFQEEIAAGSDLNNGIYFPRVPAAAVPAANMGTDFLTCFRVSRGGTPAWDNSDTDEATYSVAGPIRALPGNSTTQAATNRDAIAVSRWNAPLLMGASAPPALAANAPDWVLISRAGVPVDAPSTFDISKARNAAAANADFVIGRYAVACYEVGGLLDINVAGNLLSAEKNLRRGRMHQVDLTALPGMTADGATRLVTWRNEASASDASLLFSPTNRFLAGAGGEGSQFMERRQDLLAYSKAHPGDLPTEALPHLTVFSVALNRPAYAPPSYTPTDAPGPVISYPSTTNPQMLSVQKADGTPVASRRFPLSRIDLFANGSEADVTQYFGLTKAGGVYVYKSNTIQTPDQVAGENREPDFFELLKAAILRGSLGLASNYNTSGTYPPIVNSWSRDAATDLQILQIGANIIDQYDADSYPTVIKLGSGATADETIAGIENIPYLFNAWLRPYRRKDQGGSNPERAMIAAFTQFQFWNPHQNASGSGSGGGPSEFRVVATDGRPYYQFGNSNPISSSALVTTDDGSGGIVDYGASYSASQENTPYQIRFHNNAAFVEPTTLMPDNITYADGRANLPGEANNGDGLTGIFIGEAAAPDNRLSTVSLPGAREYDWANYRATGSYPTYEVQYRDADGQWQTYQRFPGVRFYWIQRSATGTDSFTQFTGWTDNGTKVTNLARHDPRGTRFGFSEVTSAMIGRTYRINTAAGNAFQYSRPWDAVNLNFFRTGKSNAYSVSNPSTTAANEGYYSENVSGPTVSYYCDLDRVIRRGDARSGATAAAGSYPLIAGNLSARPRILDRAFRSVGELGYVFRDLPWKTLDFTTNTPDSSQNTIEAGVVSADSGLLEAFSLDDTTSSTDDVVGGKIYLNGRDPVAFQAALQGALESEDLNSTIAAARAQALAADIVQKTLGTPLQNRAELVSRLGDVLSSGKVLKPEQEAPLRVLSEMGQADVWNLFIDLVVQAGRYPPSAQNVSQFAVDAEVRTWTHVAIDRYTGKILKIQTEIVDEQ